MIWYISWRATYDDLGELVGIYDESGRDRVHIWLGLGIGLVTGLGLWVRLGFRARSRSRDRLGLV